jgi:hypothetical protein
MRKIYVVLFILIGLTDLISQENRTFTGEGNNLLHLDWGSAESQVLRQTTVNYADGFSQVNDSLLPSPRVISNYVFDQTDNIFDSHNLSDYVWVFGQFIDHDITLVESDNREPILLEIPEDDEHFSPSEFIVTSRNKALAGTGDAPGNPRQYSNEVSSYIDGSAVYGSDAERAEWLRDHKGDGKLKVSRGNLLPWNTTSGEFSDDLLDSAPEMADDTRSLTKLYVAGDVRANENPLLIGMHTLFVREHNRLCDELRINHPNWTGDQIYQRARKYVGAYIQNVTYSEWLPAMGVVLPEYSTYRAYMDATISNVFSAAAFRIGHTLINSNVIRMDNEGSEIEQGNILLKDAFFNPFAIEIAGGIEPYFKGMGTQAMQELDCKVIDDLRNFLFGVPGAGGLDLASINIFRGRDRGVSDYNTLRSDFGLPNVSDFSDFVGSEEDAELLEHMYSNVDNIDAWVGMLAERHMSGAIFGELVIRIFEDQFQRLRDGDRFYFENDPVFTPSDINQIKATKLHDILMRNTDIDIMQENLFVAMPHSDIPSGPTLNMEPLAAVAYPNPINDHTNVKINSDTAQRVDLTVFDANGRTIQIGQYDLLPGDNNLFLDFGSELPIGIYNVLISSDEQYRLLKLIKNN